MSALLGDNATRTAFTYLEVLKDEDVIYHIASLDVRHAGVNQMMTSDTCSKKDSSKES